MGAYVDVRMGFTLGVVEGVGMSLGLDIGTSMSEDVGMGLGVVSMGTGVCSVTETIAGLAKA